MAKHLWVSKTNSVEIVRGPSLPPGVEDNILLPMDELVSDSCCQAFE